MCDSVQFLDTKNNNGNNNRQQTEQTQQEKPFDNGNDFPDLPF